MSEVLRDAKQMVAQMAPILRKGGYVFVSGNAALLPVALASFHEDEGLSLIVPAEHAPDAAVMRCITLQVHSALDGVGLTAAVATALACENIPCNMVAAYHHDHVFVPQAQAEAALAILLSLQAQG